MLPRIERMARIGRRDRGGSRFWIEALGRRVEVHGLEFRVGNEGRLLAGLVACALTRNRFVPIDIGKELTEGIGDTEPSEFVPAGHEFTR